MEVTITLDWENASDEQKAGWLVFAPLPDEFIDKIFRDLDAEQRQLCIEGQTWGPGLIAKHWDYILETQCVILLLTFQKLSPEFITSIWTGAARYLRTSILTTQKITTSLMEEIWDELADTVKVSVLLKQELPLKSIFEKWPELTARQRAAAFGLYWEGDESFLGNAELNTKTSEFLELMDQLRTEVKTNEEVYLGTLPRLLTHSNELVRALAAGYIDGRMRYSDEV